jgi:sugar-specific transcriptional regulator TrmB
MPYRKVVDVNKEETIDFMVKVVNESNREICVMQNMPKEQIDQIIEQSQEGLLHMISNLYVAMKDKELLV